MINHNIHTNIIILEVCYNDSKHRFTYKNRPNFYPASELVLTDLIL